MSFVIDARTIEEDTVVRAYRQALLIGQDKATARLCAERVLHGKYPNISLDCIQVAVARLIAQCADEPTPF